MLFGTVSIFWWQEGIRKAICRTWTIECYRTNSTSMNPYGQSVSSCTTFFVDESTVLVLVNCVSRVETSFRRRRRWWIFVFLFFFVAVVLICTALLERTHEIMEVLWWWLIFPLLRSFRWSMNVPVRRQRIYFIHDTTFRWKMCRTRVRSRILQQPARIWDARGCNLKSRNEVIYAMYICIHGRVGWCWYGLMRGYMVR